MIVFVFIIVVLLVILGFVAYYALRLKDTYNKIQLQVSKLEEAVKNDKINEVPDLLNDLVKLFKDIKTELPK